MVVELPKYIVWGLDYSTGAATFDEAQRYLGDDRGGAVYARVDELQRAMIGEDALPSGPDPESLANWERLQSLYGNTEDDELQESFMVAVRDLMEAIINPNPKQRDRRSLLRLVQAIEAARIEGASRDLPWALKH